MIGHVLAAHQPRADGECACGVPFLLDIAAHQADMIEQARANALGSLAASLRAGVTVAAFRSALARARRGENAGAPEPAWPHQEPRWEAAHIDEWVAARPGRGWRTDLEASWLAVEL